jgi:Domain of unknown function (DUF5063)
MMTSDEADFVQAVRDFCAWIQGPLLDSDDEVLVSLRLLGRLYSGILQVQDEGSSEGLGGWRPTDENRRVVASRLAHLPVRYYSELSDPFAPTEAPVQADLVDDLADIYYDLKEGLVLLEAGRQADAIWRWKDTFRLHWGRHAATALRILHSHAEQQGLLSLL